MGTLSWQVLRLGDPAASPQALGLGARGQGKSQDCGHAHFQEEKLQGRAVREGLEHLEGFQGLWSGRACCAAMSLHYTGPIGTACRRIVELS